MKIKCSKKQKYTNDNICLKLNNWVDFRFYSFNLILLDFFFCFLFIFLLLCFVLNFSHIFPKVMCTNKANGYLKDV